MFISMGLHPLLLVPTAGAHGAGSFARLLQRSSVSENVLVVTLPIHREVAVGDGGRKRISGLGGGAASSCLIVTRSNRTMGLPLGQRADVAIRRTPAATKMLPSAAKIAKPSDCADALPRHEHTAGSTALQWVKAFSYSAECLETSCPRRPALLGEVVRASVSPSTAVAAIYERDLRRRSEDRMPSTGNLLHAVHEGPALTPLVLSVPR